MFDRESIEVRVLMREFFPPSLVLDNQTSVQVLDNQTSLQGEFTSLAMENLTYLQNEFIAKPDLPPWVSNTVELDNFSFIHIYIYFGLIYFFYQKHPPIE